MNTPELSVVVSDDRVVEFTLKLLIKHILLVLEITKKGSAIIRV